MNRFWRPSPMTRSLALSLLFFSSLTFAGKVEVAQWIPWSLVKEELLQNPIMISETIPLTELSIGELRPKIHQLEFTINGEFSELTFASEGIDSTNRFMGRIHVGKIAIDQIITREFNGNMINVRLKAECSPISIEAREIRSRFWTRFIHEDLSYRPHIDGVNIEITQNSWSMSEFECQGVSGVAQEIKTQIEGALKNPATLMPLIRQRLADEVRTLYEAYWQKLINAARPELIVVSIDRPRDSGFILRGYLPLRSQREVLLPLIPEDIFEPQTPQILFSRQGLEALVEDQLLKSIPEKFNLQTFGEFRKLMKSRLAQYFAWPDLRRFPSKNPFFISLNDQEAKLRVFKQEDSWKLTFHANGLIETPIGHSPIDYIQFGIGVGSFMQVSVKDSLLEVKTSAAEVSFSWSYGLLYQLLYRPDTRIASDIIKSALGSFFSEKSYIQVLPNLNFSDRNWKLQNLKDQNGLVTMDWL